MGELQIYRGQDYKINDKIVLHHPTLGEIEDYDEEKYFSMINILCAVGADMKYELSTMDIDYTEISDFDLFCNVTSKILPKEETKIVLGEFDLENAKLYTKTENDEIVLFDEKHNASIDKAIYTAIVSYLRKIHFMKRNDEIPYNEATKRILIEEAKEKYEQSKYKEHKSVLQSLISFAVNSEGFKYNNDTVWGLKIYPFMDSIRRLIHTEGARLLLQSGYSGYGLDIKKIDNEKIDWLAELE